METEIKQSSLPIKTIIAGLLMIVLGVYFGKSSYSPTFFGGSADWCISLIYIIPACFLFFTRKSWAFWVSMITSFLTACYFTIVLLMLIFFHAGSRSDLLYLLLPFVISIFLLVDKKNYLRITS